jgi:hypothetical protein
MMLWYIWHTRYLKNLCICKFSSNHIMVWNARAASFSLSQNLRLAERIIFAIKFPNTGPSDRHSQKFLKCRIPHSDSVSIRLNDFLNIQNSYNSFINEELTVNISDFLSRLNSMCFLTKTSIIVERAWK